MRSFFCLYFLVCGLSERPCSGAENVVIETNGTVACSLPSDPSDRKPALIHVVLPQIAPEESTAESSYVRMAWLTNGIRYTFTVTASELSVAEPDGKARIRRVPILLLNVHGENTAGEYREASVDIGLEVAGQRQKLELKGGCVWTGNKQGQLVGVLEVPESGVKSAQGEKLQFSGNMPPSIKGGLTFKVPLESLTSTNEIDQLSDMDFDRELRDAQSGRKRVSSGTLPRLLLSSRNSEHTPGR